ncbi:hypothetical protein B0H11DRAFT_1944090 [Mycena galericulata]|nr:hypothetical protein B0H11DRAFT_1944090 [Mycena galericulata]
MLLSNGNTRALGTIQDAARAGTSTRAQRGMIAHPAHPLTDEIRAALVQYYNGNNAQVAFPRQALPGTSSLHRYAETYAYALLDGRRIMPISANNSGGSSIIQARFGNEAQAGEIEALFVHHQPGVENADSTLLASIKWMKPSPFTPLTNTTLWNQLIDEGVFCSPELSVDTWEFNTYVDARSQGLPRIIRVADIHCQVSRGTLTHTTPPLWITTSMDRYPTSLNAFSFGDIEPE